MKISPSLALSTFFQKSIKRELLVFSNYMKFSKHSFSRDKDKCNAERREMYKKIENVILAFVGKLGEIAQRKNQLVLCDHIQ